MFIGAIGLLFAKAASSPGSAAEPENGVLAGTASKVTGDSSTSGGAYTKFGSPAPPPTPIQILVSQYNTGTTYTQDTFKYGSDPSSVSAGKTLIFNSTYYLNQHLMGFGVGDPEPSSGTYSWTGLDTKFNSQMSGGSAIVLTGCCAPSWMKGGVPDFGGPNYSYFETAPLPANYDDYADLIAATVARYPQIKYVQVWNEMKGMWNSSLNRWNYEGYTDLYNKVWIKVKAVRSSVKIGGPYVVMGSNGGSHSYNSTVGGPWGKFDQRSLDVVTYWLQHKLGADFITIDGGNSNKDGIEPVDVFSRTDKFAAAAGWIRSLNNTTYPGAKTLPIWWAEWYARSPSSSDSQAYKNAVMATGLIRTLKSGVSNAMIWGPEGDIQGNYQPLALFQSTMNTVANGGGKATPFYQTQKWIHDYFAAGTSITDAANTNTNSNIEFLASPSKLLLVNKTASTQTTTILGASFTLNPYQVTLQNLP